MPNRKTPRSLREFDVYVFDDKQVDFGTLELRANGKIFRLTLMEAELLRHLIRNSGKIVSRKSILEEVWGLHEDTDTRAIDNFVVRLRKYIEKDPSHPQHLLTVRGVGYRFSAEPAARRVKRNAASYPLSSGGRGGLSPPGRRTSCPRDMPMILSRHPVYRPYSCT